MGRGLTISQAFAANAFFTLGQLVFDIPTGIIADSYGRRLSYLLGAGTLAFATFAYVGMWHVRAPFWMWAGASALIGLGFTFFSGANEAWLVDALADSGFFAEKQSLDAVFGRGQVVAGASMLVGSVAGGYLAQFFNLGVPYVVRGVLLLVTFVLAYRTMFDRGFKAQGGAVWANAKVIFAVSYNQGLRDPKLRWMMLVSPFFNGVVLYAMYAMQPYLLQLYGNPKAYGIAGLAAAIAAGAQIVGGATVKIFGAKPENATRILFAAILAGGCLHVALGLGANFYGALGLLTGWSLLFAIATPVRQSFLNSRIPSGQRATLLSLDSVLGSCGSGVTQVAFGRVADFYGYPASYILSGAFPVAGVALCLPGGSSEVPDHAAGT